MAEDVVERAQKHLAYWPNAQGHDTVMIRELVAEIERRSPAVSGWRSIESAPKDGTLILGHLLDDEGIEIIEWEPDGWKGSGWVHSTGKWSAFPDAWQPLPSPPGEAPQAVERDGVIEECALFVHGLWDNGIPAQEFARRLRSLKTPTDADGEGR